MPCCDGASMAGIKVVEVLHKYGIETWLLDLASYIFPLAAYKEVAKEIEKRVEAQGVHLMFGVTIDHMEQENGEKTAVLIRWKPAFLLISLACVLVQEPLQRPFREKWRLEEVLW